MQLELGVLEFLTAALERYLRGILASGDVGEAASSDGERSLHIAELDLEHLEFGRRVQELVGSSEEDEEEGDDGEEVKD